MSFLVVMALIVGGYLSSTITMAFGGSATRHGRLAALACVAVVGALLTDTFAGPVLGAIPSSKFLVLWGIFILVMMAVAFATAALQTVLGAAGTLVVIVVFVIFGAPAAGGAVPSAFLPTFWRTFGPYLPAGAGTTAVRNTIYFDGNAITRSLVDSRRLPRRGSGRRDRHPQAPSIERHRGRGVGGCCGCCRIDGRNIRHFGRGHTRRPVQRSVVSIWLRRGEPSRSTIEVTRARRVAR